MPAGASGQHADVPLNRFAAWVVLVLGAALLLGGIVGTVIDGPDDELAGTAGRLAVMALVAVGMHRAVRMLRREG